MFGLDLSTWKLILEIAGPSALGVVAAIAGVIMACKKAKKAKTAEDKANAKMEMKQFAKNAIVEAEAFYSKIGDILKFQGDSAADLKKERVMTKLQGEAISKGYEWNEEEYSQLVDDEVAFTKKVNS